MIAKARTISYGKAKLDYDASKTVLNELVASEVCRHNLYGETSAEIVREMNDVKNMSHPNLSKCYFDIVITLSESDAEIMQMPEDCQKLIEEYMYQLMVGKLRLSEEQFGKMQWIAYQHERTDHNRNLRHWHVLANRVLSDGMVVPDSHIGRKAVNVATEISRERGFSIASDISSSNKAEIHEAAFRILRGMSCFSFDLFKVLMAADGFEIREAFSKSGMLQGYYIASKSGTLYKASSIDRRLTLGRIENTWRSLRYTQHWSGQSHRVSSPMRKPDRVGSVTIANPMASVLNAQATPAHSRNREDEVGTRRGHYDDEELEERRKGYSM